MANTKFLAPLIFLLFVRFFDCNYFKKSNYEDNFNQRHWQHPIIGTSTVFRVGQQAFWSSTSGKRTAILDYKLGLGSCLLNLLLLCGDVSINPGPSYKYLCGKCEKPVKSNQRGIQCDSCKIWHHTKCIQVCAVEHIDLSNSSCAWLCTNCGLPTYSRSVLSKSFATSSLNPFSVLSLEIPTVYSAVCDHPADTSSTDNRKIGGRRPGAKVTKCNKTKSKLRCLLVNFQSLRSKTADVEQLISTYNPDIIMGTETWLSTDICDSEIFPAGFTVLRRDRGALNNYRGVLQTIRNDLIVTRKNDYESDC